MALPVACAIAFQPDFSAAQAGKTLAVDATFGAARGGGGEFIDRELKSLRIAASLRRIGPQHFGYFADLAIDAPSLPSDHFAICKPRSSGGCVPWFPSLWGPSLAAGAVARPTTRIEVRVGAGGGAYFNKGSAVGGVLGLFDVAWLAASHVGVVVGGRWILLPSYRGDRLSLAPWALGVRVR